MEDEREGMQEDDECEQMQEEEDEHIPPPLLENNEHEEMEGWGESNPKALPGDKTCGRGKAEPEWSREDDRGSEHP